MKLVSYLAPVKLAVHLRYSSELGGGDIAPIRKWIVPNITILIKRLLIL